MAPYLSPDYKTSLESVGISVQENLEDVQHRLSRWRPWQPSWISNQNDLATFDLKVTSILPLKFRVNWF